MNQLFSLQALSSLLALTFMEILLGIDNVIFVSIILGKFKNNAERKKASFIWVTVGVVVRLVLLFCLAQLIEKTGQLFSVFHHAVSLKDIITFGGGMFLLVSTTLEIHNKLEGEIPNDTVDQKLSKSFRAIIGEIILVDLVFSFDGIITAIGMVDNRLFMIRVIAVLISMAFMFIFAPKISTFIHQHPTFKMLALSFLILIAFLLVVEGIHVDTIQIPHGYVYFAMAFSFGVELLNMQIRKKSKPVELREPRLEEEERKL